MCAELDLTSLLAHSVLSAVCRFMSAITTNNMHAIVIRSSGRLNNEEIGFILFTLRLSRAQMCSRHNRQTRRKLYVQHSNVAFMNGCRSDGAM